MMRAVRAPAPAPRRRRRARRLASGVLLVVLAGAGCSGDDDGSDPTTFATGTQPQVGSRLVLEGGMTCTDEAGDVTASAETMAEPPIETAGTDLLSVQATLDDELFTATFNLAGAPDLEAEPEYLVLVGFVEDLTGFEIQLQHEDGLWIAMLVQRTEEISQPTPLPDATVTGRDDGIVVSVPVDALPPIGVNQPVFFGATSLLHEGEQLLNAAGEPVETETLADRAIDDCTEFGQ
jgi:hypothetical protein